MRHRSILWLMVFLIIKTLYTQPPPPTNPHIENVITEISSANIKATVEKLVSFGTRHSLSDTSSETKGIGAARRWIKSEFERYAKKSIGRMKVEFQEFLAPGSARVPYPAKIVNVIATLQPSNLIPTKSVPSSNRILIVSAHYDSRASNPLDSVSQAPGANDDGSGTALVLELARVFSKYEFDATIMFVAFAGEEQGLLGSRHFAAAAKEQGWHIEAVFNNDIVGNIHSGDGTIESTYVRLFSEAYSPIDTGTTFRLRNLLGLENDGSSRGLARYIKEIGERYVPNFGVKLIYRRDRFLRGGDHLPFHEQGFAAVRFTEAKENFDHQHQDVRTKSGISYGDLPEYMNFEYCAAIARINAATLASLAFAPVPPSNVRIMTRSLEYTTTLQWNKNAESDLAGYNILYRETTSPTWQHTLFTQDTAITLQVSKDDYFFGIQAVDRAGNASLYTIPLPLR
ncbi:MAG: M20/M25/M40 family metallo-hydrolase [Ignavibacteriae bacterium]|nr:M20/M25/M40 family metallo-hydrolase [Ignavibacteriota bacterium]